MGIIRFLSHPFWTGVSTIVAIIALFWSSGVGREFDRLTHSISPKSEQTSEGAPKGGEAADKKPAQPKKAGRRLALLIANSDYGGVSTLQNPGNDIKKVGAALSDKGFDVITKFDLDYKELKQAISDFDGVLKGGGVGLIYYAGHAMHRDGHDILLPVDISSSVKSNLTGGVRGFKPLAGRASKAAKVPYTPPPIKDRIPGAIYLTELLKPVDLIIDERGADSGSAVIYSASRGQVSMDAMPSDPTISPFAKAFQETVQSGDLELFEVFRKLSALVPKYSDYLQSPTVEATISRPFYFSRPWRDEEIGVLKLVMIDSCRTDLNLGVWAHSKAPR